MANEDKYIPEGSGPEGTVQQGDDLKESSKDTLASYLSNLTTNSATQNSYPVQDIARVETSLTNGGLPAEFQTGGQDANTGFTRSFPEGGTSSNAAVSYFETLSDSGKIETLGSVLNKNSQSDGHHLLTDIVSNREPGEPGVGDPTGASSSPNPAGATPIQQKISGMLQNGNRFDPIPGSSPYIEGGEFTQPGIPIEQGGLGIYDDSAVRTSLDDLHKVAHSMMVRATGARLGVNSDPDGGSAVSTTNVQKGSSKVNFEKLRASNAFRAPEDFELQDAELRYSDIDGTALSPQRSYGQMSSYREKFASSPIANMNTTVQSLGEYLIGAAAFTAVISLVELLEATSPVHNPAKPHTLRKGQWHKENSLLKMLRAMGIPYLGHPTWLCAIYGFAAWLKIPPSALPDPSGGGGGTPPPPPSAGMGAVAAWFAGIAAAGPSILFNMLYGAGYYATVMRVVRRDLDSMLSDVNWSDAGNTSGPDAARAIFDLLMSLQSYTSWNFFIAILRMGDAWISSYRKYVRFNHMKMSGQTKQQHSRTPFGQKGLAWRHRSAPALLLLNQKYVNASTVFGYDPNFLKNIHNALGDTYSRSPDNPYYGNLRSGGRARGLYENRAWNMRRETPETVRLVENELDAEYCPFYFHDLRTNEIMSFHAFISDLKDSYSVSYAESGGYGRIDKVKIYQDTTRSISLSFTMVATSPKDFDSMWYSFNKLISMIYPQFSMGKPVKAGSKKFVMPFSQIPTASPVIRLRVGDVIRSNYSRFNLARIFGLSEVKPAAPASAGGSDAAEIADAPFDISATAAVDSAAAAAAEADATAAADLETEMTNRFGSEPTSFTDVTRGYLPGDPNWGKAVLSPSSTGYTTYDTDNGIQVSAAAGAASVAAVVNKHNTNEPPEGATHVTASPFTSRPTTAGIVKVFERVVVGPGEGMAMDQPDDEAHESPHAEYFVQYTNRDDAADPYGPVSEKGHFHTYVVTSADLTPITPTIEPTEPVDPAITLEDQITDVVDFFDPDNNAIVRSFEAAGGRGLAGVITSIDFDWGDAQWDMSGIGRRAPTLLNVSIAFSPIHDIVPGLDNNGMMRAINYPVGGIAGPMGTDFYDPGGVRSDSFSSTTSGPGAGDINDATGPNHSGFAGSQDTDGEGG